MTPTPAHGDGRPRRRLLALAALLLVSLGLAAALAVETIRTAARHRDTAQRTLNDYADFGAFILASRVYRQLGSDVVHSFTTPPTWQRAAFGAANAPAGTACPTGTSYFEREPGSEALRWVGPPLPATDAAFLRDTLRNAMKLLEEVGWRFRFVRLPAGAAVQGYFLTSQQLPSGRYGLRGFSACLGGAESPFRAVMRTERALPPAVTGRLAADSLYSITVSGADGRALYASPTTWTSPYHGRAVLGTEFGDLELRLALRPAVANRLVIGGIPSSPTPLAVGLLALSTLLIVTALLQLRREYELVGLRSAFVSSVSHELRTPLAQILIFAELLKLGRLRSDAERARALDVIDQETRRLIRLVENVLQFSRSGGDRSLAHEPVALGAVVQETLDAFRPLATARDVSFATTASDDLVVFADRGAVRQILLNLLDNAVKYGPRGQTVRVRAEQRGDDTQLAVEDQGPGIPHGEQARVWEDFYRLPRDSGSTVTGSGIGLAVVRALAQQMGAAVHIEDAPGGGARFVVTWPRNGGAS